MLGAGPPNVDLKHLTEEERDLILSVLKRDEDLHSRDQQRVEALRCDISALKQKSALRPGDGDADKTCSRCRKPFGWFFDKGEMCPKCKHKVCEACRVQMEKGSTKWNCILCQKQRELNAMSGQWFFSKFRKSKRDRKTKKVISGTELVRQSFKRPPPERRPNGASRQDERSWARAGARVRASESGDETSDTQSAKDMAMGRRPRKVAQIHDAAFPKDAERIMLLDLLGGPAPELSAPSQPQVDVRRVSARRYASGSSSDSDRDSAPSSPQLSQRTLSDYAPSDSVRSSFRSTSAASDGRITLVTDQSGVSDVSSPASLQHSPALSNASSIEQSHQHYMQVTSPPHNRPPDHRDRFQYEPRNRHTAHQNSSLYAPTSPVGPTGKSPLPTPRRSHQQQRAQPSGRSALNHPTHSGDWEPPAQQPRHPRLQPDSSPRKSDSKSSADSAIDNPSHFSTSSLSEEAPPGSQGAHTQVERGARSASSSSNEDVSTHRALQEMAQPVKQQAPPPPKPARMRTASSSSEAERLRGELEYYDMKAPSLAREGAGRNSLERQRRVDENAGPARASSRAMTEAERAASVESVTSFYSDAGEGNYGRIPVSGEIEFGLDYNYKVGSLEVRVKQCRDIAVIDSKKKRTDPSQTDTTETGEVKETEAKKPAGHVNTNVYVKTYLLPDKTKSGKRKTRVKKHTTNPVFNELLKYTISKSELETRTLWVTVWHNDTFGRNDFLGEVTMPLDYYEFKDPAPKWHKLQERNAAPLSLLTYKGDVSLQLKYVSAEHVGASRKVKGKTGVHGELHVLVKQARHLTAVRANGSSDPFCKAYLLPEKGKGSKQKSPVVRKNCNPQWRHTFVFEEVGGEELRECALELTIWDHDRFVSNDFLGGVRLSLGTGKSFGKEVEWSDSKAEEISLWQSMLDRPNHWVEATLLLRPNMDPRKAAA